MQLSDNRKGILLAVLAAVLYAVSSPLSKLLLRYMGSVMMAGFLYLGAGVGMIFVALGSKFRHTAMTAQPFTVRQWPYILAMILLDIAAPVLLLAGLNLTTAENVSLLNNFEIVATAVIALLLFKEKISARLWTGIIFVVISCAVLSVESFTAFRFSYGSVFVLLACVCWGVENNCTRRLSDNDPLQVVILKGIFSGSGSLAIALALGQSVSAVWAVFAVMAVGLVAYGLSIFFYVNAQRYIGASRTSAYYAVSPFVGVVLSFILFREMPQWTFFIALALMGTGAWLCGSDKPVFARRNKSDDGQKS